MAPCGIFRIAPGMLWLIEVWPTEAAGAKTAASPWLPLEETSAAAPVLRLAARIADTIAHWLKSGETLESEGVRSAPATF